MSKCRYDLSEDCHNKDCLICVLDKIRAEIKKKIEQEEFARSVFRHEEKDAVKAEQCTGSIFAYNNVIRLTDKYKAESEPQKSEVKMGMTIEEAENYLIALKQCETCEATDTNACKTCSYYRRGSSAKCYDAIDVGISTMRKYQKIEDIYYHQSGEALENSLRAVIEDGNVD